MVGKERDECINTMKRILDSENERINTAGRGASLAAFELLSDIFPLSSLATTTATPTIFLPLHNKRGRLVLIHKTLGSL